MLTLRVLDKNNKTLTETSGDDIYIFYNKEYQKGDYIELESTQNNIFVHLQLDDAIGESLVYLKEGKIEFKIPFDEKKLCYSEKSFSGTKHLMSARVAEKEEIYNYRNLTSNKYDYHGNNSFFPHASANVETRDESVFAAKNAINCNRANKSHGNWPFESWGINRNPDAKIKIEFGRTLILNKIKLYIRADFPHDNWWENITLKFSNGEEITFKLEKTHLGQTITFDQIETNFVELKELKKANDPSEFPALAQIEAYGSELL
ncbi:carbohydrate-binding protein [Thiospirochaeta perfilievii]|uniref:Carbohydrate-binding protein n=1 Tax=Thiospirochaeta perfilievii TaxID=252967 RepID=A0A5C1QC40_9SPIO|nr:carbohydrate-binding protein [Thiospirochaeta perfilievii]QEN04469.1 carbohydrate-binding protein [Thiospirochaeta perfilievii]